MLDKKNFLNFEDRLLIGYKGKTVEKLIKTVLDQLKPLKAKLSRLVKSNY